MKIGIRAVLQALLEADDQIGGKSLGESALTLVRRHRATKAAATAMQSEIGNLKAATRWRTVQITALASERDALAAARDALEHQLAEVTGQRNRYQRNALNLSEQQATFVRECDTALIRASKGEAQLATMIAQYNAAQLALTDAREENAKTREAYQTELKRAQGDYAGMMQARAKWEADERTYLADIKDIAKQRDEAHKRKLEVLAELGETRALCHHYQQERDTALRERDAANEAHRIDAQRWAANLRECEERWAADIKECDCTNEDGQ